MSGKHCILNKLRIHLKRKDLNWRNRMHGMHNMQIFKCRRCFTFHNYDPASHFCFSRLYLCVFHARNTISFSDVQTSVAVISPSKAKSVWSLSVCVHKRSKTVPSGKQRRNDKNPAFKSLHYITHRQILHYHRWNRWKCSGRFCQLQKYSIRQDYIDKLSSGSTQRQIKENAK